MLLEVGGVLGVVHADLAQNWAVDPAPEPGLVFRDVQPAHKLADPRIAGFQLAQALDFDVGQPALRLCNRQRRALALVSDCNEYAASSSPGLWVACQCSSM